LVIFAILFAFLNGTGHSNPHTGFAYPNHVVPLSEINRENGKVAFPRWIQVSAWRLSCRGRTLQGKSLVRVSTLMGVVS